jgi:hypothetical protein
MSACKDKIGHPIEVAERRFVLALTLNLISEPDQRLSRLAPFVIRRTAPGCTKGWIMRHCRVPLIAATHAISWPVGPTRSAK